VRTPLAEGTRLGVSIPIWLSYNDKSRTLPPMNSPDLGFIERRGGGEIAVAATNSAGVGQAGEGGWTYLDHRVTMRGTTSRQAKPQTILGGPAKPLVPTRHARTDLRARLQMFRFLGISRSGEKIVSGRKSQLEQGVSANGCIARVLFSAHRTRFRVPVASSTPNTKSAFHPWGIASFPPTNWEERRECSWEKSPTAFGVSVSPRLPLSPLQNILIEHQG